MVTVVVLGVGTLMVQEGFLRSASVLSRCSNSLKAQMWIEEKMWESRETLLTGGTPSEETGDFDLDGRNFAWSVVPETLTDNLSTFAVSVAWRDGDRHLVVTREMYAAKLADEN